MRSVVTRLKDCANGIGSFKTERGDFGLCEDAIDEIFSRDALIKELVGALRNSSATIVAVYQWLEMVEKEGGATSIAGVAKCHAMLTSLRKNADRTEKLIMTPARDALTRANEAGYGAQERNGDES